AIYHSADFFAEGYHYPNITYNLDISNMQSIADNTYDCLIACDVLEHVAEDQKALTEIKRVLKPNGICILTVPQKDHLEITDEDLSMTNAAEREKRFGQSDHLRIYGFDFINKMQVAGFNTEIVDEKYFGKDFVQKHVLFPEILSKQPMATNYRKLYFGKK
ncbi:MAG: class I SAM-dependent methyltransferase, partial [Bacteroidota bacterium]